ncbi:MAG: 50S ribosomal protein L32 [Phycisphaeraceae bacterium]|nr:50S ribosomal protein L32 [Phycisphaeraceae bacterium]
MNPVQRKSKSQSRMRRSHQALKKIASVRCPNCGGAKLPHAACMSCGFVRPGVKLALSKEEE